MNKATTVFIVSLCLAAPTLAQDLSSLFPYAAQSHASNGTLAMNWSTSITGARQYNGKKGYLDFNKQSGTLHGQCDGFSCVITGDSGPSYPLPAFNDEPLSLPAFKSGNSNKEAKCSGSGSLSFGGDKYESVSASGSCKLYLSNDGDVVIKGELAVSGSSDLYLAAGNYWMDSLSLSGSSKLIVTTPGEVNLYVKSEANLNGSSPLGSEDAPVNLYHYSERDIVLNGSLTWHGDLYSRGDLEILGSSKLYGTVQARSLELGGSAQLYQQSGEYWFDRLEVVGSAQLIPSGSGSSSLHVRSKVEVKGSARIGTEDMPLIIFVHGGEQGNADDAKVELEGSASIIGHVYARGDLDMNGSTRIYGAANVVDLEMEGSSAIFYRPAEVALPASLHHYELHFNSCTALLTAKACGDENCSVLYDEKATIHVQNQGHPPRNIANFNHFLGLAQQDISQAAEHLNYRFTLGYQAKGNGGNLSPKPAAGLVCYVDGQRTCTVNGRNSTGDGSGGFRFAADTAYAGGEAMVSMESNGCTASTGQVQLVLSFATASGQNNDLTIRWPEGTASLQPGQSRSLTLPLNGVTLSYPDADLITLTVKEAETGSTSQDQVAFVPKQWLVNEARQCLDNADRFDYELFADSCTPLAKVGERVNFSVSALDINNDPLPLGWLASQVNDNNLIRFTVSNGEHGYALSQGLGGGGLSAEPDIVGVASVQVEDWEAGYIPSGDSALMTHGDDQTIGRTVPASLQLTGQSGAFEQDAVYADKPVAFVSTPSFIVQGLDTQGRVLASYSGEFAGGLMDTQSVSLASDGPSTPVIADSLQAKVELQADGDHRISLLNDSLVFLKEAPFAESRVLHPLTLVVALTKDGLAQVAQEVNLVERGTVRYGYLDFSALELPINTSGIMQARLSYYDGDDVPAVVAGFNMAEHIGQAAIGAIPLLNPAIDLSPVAKGVLVSPYASAQEKIEVSLGVEPWLQQWKEGELTNPVAILKIVEEGRLRGNDKTFNRREVIR
ncbi:hypothetical protein [Zobellella sp. An-6]|uniref:hypothetical protein n=1 Tax=Zobellella sp. An-6 TaxID=3400218 RepID=UPI0040419EEA